MTRSVTAATLVLLLGCSSAFAQVGATSTLPGTTPLAATSPLGIGPGTPAPPARLPLGLSGAGATQCGVITSLVPEVSFGAGTASGMGSAMTGASTNAAGMGASTTTGMAGMPASTSVFDGGGTVAAGSASCSAAGSSSSAPAASASSHTSTAPTSTSSAGRAGIPLDSTELNGAGVSPP
jgi:hypothetical protein